MRIGSLFSGIGGFELGLEWAGLGETLWQVEIDPFCRTVLERHWPNARRFADVTKVGTENLEEVDIICGGPPCQPFSTASRGRRTAADLFPEFRRIILATRPRFVVAENVARDPIEREAEALRKEGYAATTIEMAASVVGADHERVRWWVVADSDGQSEPRCTIDAEVASLSDLANFAWSPYGTGGLGGSHGAADRMDRLRALGNAVVPQCAEVIGHIVLHLAERSLLNDA